MLVSVGIVKKCVPLRINLTLIFSYIMLYGALNKRLGKMDV